MRQFKAVIFITTVALHYGKISNLSKTGRWNAMSLVGFINKLLSPIITNSKVGFI